MRIKYIAIATIVVVFGLLAAGCSNQADSLTDFRDDLGAMGFSVTASKQETESTGSGKARTTKTVFEAVVYINGCDVELERSLKAPVDKNLPEPNPRQIESYTVDEVNYKGQEIKAKLPGSPTPDEVKRYLGENAGTFPCFKS